MTQGVIVPPGGGDEQEVGHQAHGHHGPDHAAHHVGVAGLDQRQRLDGVADAQVTVHADAGEEEDAAVQVGVEQEAHYFTGSQSKGPVAAVGVVVDEGGQGEDVQEVGQGEVEHVDGAGVPRAHPQEQPQGRGIEHEAEHKHQAVGHRQQDVFELLVEATARVEDRGERRRVVACVGAADERLHREATSQCSSPEPAEDQTFRRRRHSCQDSLFLVVVSIENTKSLKT